MHVSKIKFQKALKCTDMFVAKIQNFVMVVLTEILNTRSSSLLLSPKQLGKRKYKVKIKEDKCRGTKDSL